jgi:hypothetical protein
MVSSDRNRRKPMARCELLDYSDRDDSLEPLVEYHRVTQRSIASLPAEVLYV